MSGKLQVGATDARWHHFLAARSSNETNFWISSPNAGFSVHLEGGLVLFAIHCPAGWFRTEFVLRATC